ncbi:MAG: hypothetical protein ACKV2T_01280 [Kofleriaceae bacterium]
MVSWDEIRELIRSKFKVAMDEPTWMGLAFGLTIDNREVAQRVRVEPTTALEQPAVLIWGDVVDVSRVPTKLALQRNMSFEIGALAISEKLYVLRVVLPLETTSLSLLEAAIQYVAREAARLREGVPSN